MANVLFGPAPGRAFAIGALLLPEAQCKAFGAPVRQWRCGAGTLRRFTIIRFFSWLI